jgi:hypothetical protein
VHRRAVCRLIGDVVGRDHDLAIGHLAQGTGILASHAHRAAPLLGQLGVIQDQEAVGRALRDQGLHALLIQVLRGPGRIGQEVWQAFGRGPRHGSGNGVTVLAGQVGQQVREVPLHARPAGRTAEERRKGREKEDATFLL